MNEEKKVQYLNTEDVLPNRFQPRIKFDENSLNELTDSIKEHGVIQPITVRPLGDKYEIIAGERRYKASLLAGKTTVPAIVVDLNDKDSAEIALIENVQRKDLTPIEEAISYKKILDMNYLNQEQLAAKLGKTQSTVANKLRLLNLTDDVQEALLDGKISERHARSLLRLNKKENQDKMLKRIIEERLTVRKTDEEIDKMNKGNDIEIMDFDFDTTEPVVEPIGGLSAIPEVETTSKDDEMDRFYNIPSEPIVEDKEDIIPIPNNGVNPGFMNVDKIEKEASDIHKEKSVANIEELLKSPITMTNPVPVIPDEQTEEEETPKFRQGRFFTLLDDEEETENNKPTFEPKPIDNRPSLLEQLNSPNTITNTNQLNTNKEETNAFSLFDTMPTPQLSVSPVPPVSLGKEVKDEPIDFSMPSFDFVPEITPLQTVPRKQESVVEPMNEQNSQVSVAEIEKPEEVQVANNSRYGADLKTVINTIRNCSSTIEKYGYVVDTEEFDFEDMYQVIFKIQKNKK